MAVLRSRKFQQHSDEEILTRYANSPTGEELYFLLVEIEERNLRDRADIAVAENRKRSRHSILYYLFYALMFGFFLLRFGGDFI